MKLYLERQIQAIQTATDEIMREEIFKYLGLLKKIIFDIDEITDFDIYPAFYQKQSQE